MCFENSGAKILRDFIDKLNFFIERQDIFVEILQSVFRKCEMMPGLQF